jgi:hypothetical protein
MAVLTETAHAAEFILSEAAGTRSREAGVVDTGNLAPGTVVMLSGSKLVAYDAGSSSAAVGIILYAANATSADVPHVTYIARDAEVNEHLIVYPSGQLAATKASLKLLGIIVRGTAA